MLHATAPYCAHLLYIASWTCSRQFSNLDIIPRMWMPVVDVVECMNFVTFGACLSNLPILAGSPCWNFESYSLYR